MESKNIEQLLDQLIDRLTAYRKKHVIIADFHSKYELEKRIEDLETKIKFLRQLPLERQNEISRQELESLLASLPLNFDDFELQKFDNALKIFIENSKNVFVGNTFTGDNINVDIGDKHYHQYGEKKIKPILTELPSNEKFEGRKKELAELKEQIATHKSISVISINGIGGIGKSALSKAFFLENYKEYDFALFLKGKSNVYDTFNDYTLLDNLGIAEKVHSIPYQTPNRNEIVFGIIKNALSNLEGKKLLLIDDASENSHLLKDLIQSDWEILTTSRQKIDFMYSFELLQATPEDAIAIFCVYYGKTIEDISQEEKAQIQRLVNRLALHPLAIELVAKNIKRKDWTFEETNQKLAEKGLNIDEKTNLTTTHSQEKIKDIFEYLLQLFPLENLTEEELKLLNVYSVLPNLPITKQTWKTLLGETEDHWQELSTELNERGLINKNGKAFEIHALLAEIVRYKNEDRLDDDCEEMIISLTDELDYQDNIDYHKEDYKYTSFYILYSKSIVNYIKDSDTKGTLYERIGHFYAYLGNLTRALEAYQDLEKVSKNLIIKEPTNSNFKNGLAISYQFLGQTNQKLGNLKISLDFFEKRKDLAEQLYKEFPNNVEFKNGLAISYQFLGQINQKSRNLQLALDFFEKYNDLEKQLHKEFPNTVEFKNLLAISYQFLGQTNQELGNLQLALDFFEKYNDLEKQLHKESPNNVNFKNALAVSYQFLGQTNQELGNLKIALSFFEEYNDLAKQLHKEFPNTVEFKNLLAISYQFLGITNKELGSLKIALDLFEKCNDLAKQLHKEFPNMIEFKKLLAISYSKLGETNQELGNSKIALSFFEEYNDLAKQLYKEFPNTIEFKNLLAISYQFLGITNKELENLKIALVFFEKYNNLEKQLHKEFPNIVEFKNLLAISYQFLGITNQELGNLQIALESFKKRKDLAEQLYNEFPNNVNFKNGLAVSFLYLGMVSENLLPVFQAKSYYLEGEQLYQELVNDFPHHPNFQQNLAFARQQLKKLQ